MKRLILFILVLLFLTTGCELFSRQKPAISIGKIKISKQEFDDAFASSIFRSGDIEARKQFLERFISRKLILQEAERLGLDKDPQFLKDIQLFWEQSLLKLALSKKIKELSLDTQVSDAEVRKYYDNNKDIEFMGQEIAQVYDQIKWLILNEKQRDAIKEWADSLQKDTEIKIEYDLLGIK
ncbi:MAG: SurA N-terminal domain-containing protein [Candidatus Omnitrophica bacterium]|nr:SurA N-terminal domain-containing protein [Candidatus Omnitrophota bacterium]